MILSKKMLTEHIASIMEFQAVGRDCPRLTTEQSTQFSALLAELSRTGEAGAREGFPSTS